VADRAQDAFLEDLSRRAFRYFLDQSNAKTGLVLDRAKVDGGAVERSRNVASIAATGFGLTGLCIAAERRWLSRDDARARATAGLRFIANELPQVHGWFYHFVDVETGERVWKCELSSIDTALLAAGVLTCGVYFGGEAEKLSRTIYDRVDFRWMQNGDTTLSHGWKPESGFLQSRWSTFSECLLLYALAMYSRTTRVDVWQHVVKPVRTYDGFRYIEGGPLFVHQFPQAWLDLRRTSWFANSTLATRANRAFCLDLRTRFPKSYSENVWGITASDSAHGYIAWGIPGDDRPIDGTVVPCAPGGSLMFAPDICVPALMTMRKQFGDQIWGKYGFADAFNPTTGWYDGEVIGIDQGITLLSAENLRSGAIWRWFPQGDPVHLS
jgi:hypothetical protein